MLFQSSAPMYSQKNWSSVIRTHPYPYITREQVQNLDVNNRTLLERQDKAEGRQDRWIAMKHSFLFELIEATALQYDMHFIGGKFIYNERRDAMYGVYMVDPARGGFLTDGVGIGKETIPCICVHHDLSKTIGLQIGVGLYYKLTGMGVLYDPNLVWRRHSRNVSLEGVLEIAFRFLPQLIMEAEEFVSTLREMQVTDEQAAHRIICCIRALFMERWAGSLADEVWVGTHRSWDILNQVCQCMHMWMYPEPTTKFSSIIRAKLHMPKMSYINKVEDASAWRLYCVLSYIGQFLHPIKQYRLMAQLPELFGVPAHSFKSQFADAYLHGEAPYTETSMEQVKPVHTVVYADPIIIEPVVTTVTAEENTYIDDPTKVGMDGYGFTDNEWDFPET